MPRTTCTRRLVFDAGHRVVGHEGKCAALHGHRYVVEIEAAADALDNLGRVVDFSVIKQRVGGWIDENWDHGLILWQEDAAMQAAVAAFVRFATPADRTKVYYLPKNPTAENIAKHLFDVATGLLQDTGVCIWHVRIYETENCWADARSDSNSV